MTSEASWQYQSTEQQEWDSDHDLHIAWCNVAMGLATDYAEAYCNHQCDDSKDNLHELGRTRRELKRHLLNQPASMGPLKHILSWAETEMRYAGWDKRVNDQHGRTDVYEAIVEFLK